MQAVTRRHIEWLAEADHEVFLAYPEHIDIPDGALPVTRVPLPWRNRKPGDVINPWCYVRDLQAFSVVAAGRITEVRPNLVYTEGPLVAEYLKTPRHLRVPIIYHPHGLEPFQDFGSVSERFCSMPLRGVIATHAMGADVVLSQGGLLHDLLLHRIGVPKEKIRYLPNSVTVEVNGIRRSGESSLNKFLFVGRNEPRKGLRTLLRAMRSLPTVSLTVVGRVDRDIDGRSNVKCVGEIRDRATLGGFYNRSDFLVLPSFSEGMPTVILEAFAAGLPVIASDVGAVATAVVDKCTGFLIPPGNEVALVAAMRRASGLSLSDYQAMSEACLNAVATLFSSGKVRQLLVQIVDDVARM